MTLGAACATGTLTDPEWTRMYREYSIGGLVYSILVLQSLNGFGQFLCVVLAMSTVANNIPNMYSVSLSAQAFWSPMRKNSRIFSTLAGNFVCSAICIPAFYNFEEIMDNFMNLIGYYLAIYEAMCLSEHFIWNRGRSSAYDYKNFHVKTSYPVGFAGVFGFCCGVAEFVLCMNQVWYLGVIARKIDEYGGDIGFEVGAAFAAIGFNAVRHFEKKYVGR